MLTTLDNARSGPLKLTSNKIAALEKSTATIEPPTPKPKAAADFDDNRIKAYIPGS